MVRWNRWSLVSHGHWRTKLAAVTAGAACACVWLAACSTASTGEESHGEREYRTGSNIAVKDRSAASDAKSYDPNSVQDAARSTLPRPPVGLKGG